MHQLQPKHSKLKLEEVKILLKKFNVSPLQLPNIKITDKALPIGAIKVGDIIKIDRKESDGTKVPYYRVVIA